MNASMEYLFKHWLKVSFLLLSTLSLCNVVLCFTLKIPFVSHFFIAFSGSTKFHCGWGIIGNFAIKSFTLYILPNMNY